MISTANQRLFYRLLIGLLLWLSTWPAFAAVPDTTLLISGDTPRVAVGTRFQYRIDDSNTDGLAEAQGANDWRNDLRENAPIFPFTTSTIWIRLQPQFF